MNVKAEGKNIQLLGEAMLNNGSSPPYNSGTPTGNVQAPTALDAMETLQSIVNNCENSVPATENGKKKTCTKLGAEKHACCEKAIQEHREANPPDGKPPLEGEKGYKRPTKKEQRKRKPSPPTSIPGSRQELFNNAVSDAIAAGTDVGESIGKALGGKCFPDSAIMNADGSKTMVDFKFPCPKGHPSGKGTSKGGVKTAMSPEQQASYDAISKGTCDGPAQTIMPSQLSFGF
jgi:hypothetical protein